MGLQAYLVVYSEAESASWRAAAGLVGYVRQRDAADERLPVWLVATGRDLPKDRRIGDHGTHSSASPPPCPSPLGEWTDGWCAEPRSLAEKSQAEFHGVGLGAEGAEGAEEAGPDVAALLASICRRFNHKPEANSFHHNSRRTSFKSLKSVSLLVFFIPCL